MLTTEGRFDAGPFKTFSSAINPPKLVPVSAHAASTIEAFGAAADAHSTSSAASASSPKPGSVGSDANPGLVHVNAPLGLSSVRLALGYFCARPNVARKTF